MKQKLQVALARVHSWLKTPLAWRIALGFFVFEALWFVCSAQYPMAFDENYHFGLIKLHAAQWVPFFTAQPDNAAVYGAVVRDPSYLYHWLMSFPYRLIAACTNNMTAQIIFLRLINVGIFAGGLVLYRRILRRLGVPVALLPCIVLIFALIPVVPFLAAHINYDNLFLLAVALTILLALRLMDSLKQGKIAAMPLFLLVSVMLLSGLIKYPYLPILLVTALFLLWYGWRHGALSRAGWKSFTDSFVALSTLRRVLLVSLVVISFGLFAERYIANLVVYHNPVPSCDAVISQDECIQYGPYGRDHVYASEKPADFRANVFVYIADWFWGMWFRLFFAINYDYATARPLLVISWLAVVLAVLLGIGVLLRFRALFAGRPGRQLLLVLILGYGLVLFQDGFAAYAKTARPVAINGRYWIPFLPFIFAFGGMAWAQILRRFPAWRTGIATLVIGVFLLQGGGTMTFIVRSSDTWMWDNAAVRSVNRVVRSIAWPVILGKNVQ